MPDAGPHALDAPRTMLEAEMLRRGQGYSEIAAEFQALATRDGAKATLSTRHLRRLAAGEHSTPNPETRRLLAKILGLSASELLAPVDRVPSRTVGLPAIGAVLDETELFVLTERRARDFTIFSPAALPEGTVDQLFDDVHRLCIDQQHKASVEVLGDLARTQNDVYTLLEQRQRPSDARTLYLLAAVAPDG